MNRLLLCSLTLFGLPLLTHAAWIDPASLSVTVEGTASSPSGENSFSETESLENSFGSRFVTGEVESCSEVAPGFSECSGSSASAVAAVTGDVISFNSYVHPQPGGSGGGFDANATSRAEFTFEVSREVPTRFTLSVDRETNGGHSWFSATMTDELGSEVLSLTATTTVLFGTPAVGEATWLGETLKLSDFLNRDWTLTPGFYTLAMGAWQERLPGGTSPGDYEFQFVPEPSAIHMVLLSGIAVIWLGRHLRNRTSGTTVP